MIKLEWKLIINCTKPYIPFPKLQYTTPQKHSTFKLFSKIQFQQALDWLSTNRAFLLRRLLRPLLAALIAQTNVAAFENCEFGCPFQAQAAFIAIDCCREVWAWRSGNVEFWKRGSRLFVQNMCFLFSRKKNFSFFQSPEICFFSIPKNCILSTVFNFASLFNTLQSLHPCSTLYKFCIFIQHFTNFAYLFSILNSLNSIFIHHFKSFKFHFYSPF
jgi:hypothetical protein